MSVLITQPGILESDRKFMAPTYAGSLFTAWRTAGVAGIARRMEGAAESSVFFKNIFCSYLSNSFLFFSAFSDIHLLCIVHSSMHGLRGESFAEVKAEVA